MNYMISKKKKRNETSHPSIEIQYSSHDIFYEAELVRK